MFQSLKRWRWIQARSVYHYPSTICIIVSDKKWKKSGTLCEMETLGMNFQPTQQQISSLVLAVLSKWNAIDEPFACFKEKFHWIEMICLWSKTWCCCDSQSFKFKFSRKCLNERTLEDCGDGPLSNYHKVLEEITNVTSTNGGFRTKQHAVATYEQTKKGLSYVFHQRNV